MILTWQSSVNPFHRRSQILTLYGPEWTGKDDREVCLEDSFVASISLDPLGEPREACFLCLDPAPL